MNVVEGATVEVKNFRAFFIVAVALFSAGCGPSSEYPTVSGKVTFDGAPLSKIRVVFNPIPVGNSAVAGPYSTGVTDEEGNFSLKTRNGESGAVGGAHKVGFSWSDIGVTTLSSLKKSLRDSKDSPEDVAKIKSMIAEVEQKLQSRPKLESNLQAKFSVPQEGTDQAVFELTDLGGHY